MVNGMVDECPTHERQKRLPLIQNPCSDWSSRAVMLRGPPVSAGALLLSYETMVNRGFRADRSPTDNQVQPPVSVGFAARELG